MSTAFALSSATGSISVINHRPIAKSPATVMMFKSCASSSHSNKNARTSRLIRCCQVALKSTASVESDPLTSSSSSSSTEAEAEEKSKEGARIRVKVPLKVYHVNRVPELDLSGKEGIIKQYVGVWKGKRISSNLPYKVQFFTDIPGRGSVKFFAHLKEDEFEYLDD